LARDAQNHRYLHCSKVTLASGSSCSTSLQSAAADADLSPSSVGEMLPLVSVLSGLDFFNS